MSGLLGMNFSSGQWLVSGFPDEASLAMDRQIAVTLEAGFKHLDLRNLESGNIVDLKVKEAKTIAKAIEDAGLSVNMFGSPIGKIDIADDFEIDLERLSRLGQLADVFGCRGVRVFSYFNAHGGDDAKWRRITLERLGELKRRAIELGLYLFHENEHGIYGSSCKRNIDIGRELRDGQHFRMIFDFDNYNQLGEDVFECWQNLAEMTDAFHMKESDANCQHVPFGTGATRSLDILNDAKARKWRGCLSLEPHLSRSQAVLATGPSGQANQTLSDLSDEALFGVGASAAMKVLQAVDVELA